MKRNHRHWADKLDASDIQRIIAQFEDCKAYAKPLADKKRELWVIAYKRVTYMKEFWTNMLAVQQRGESLVPYLRTLRNITWDSETP